MREKTKNIRNLSEMVKDLDEVEVGLSDLKKLGLSLLMDAKEEKTKVDVLKALMDIELKTAKEKSKDDTAVLNLLDD